MGFFLSTVKDESRTFESQNQTWIEPLDKVKQYHGVFKSICDTFQIKKSQFLLIFGSEDKIDIWDKQKTQSIDALEIFCGLIYYASNATFKSKLRFLFTIFDFNEIKSISIVDLQYMLLCICNSTYKILKKTNTKADQLKLAEWLGRHLNANQRIKITTLYAFCMSSIEIKQFLALTQMKIERKPQINEKSQKIHENGNKNALIQNSGKFLKDKNSTNERYGNTRLEGDKEIENKLSWLNDLSKKLTKSEKYSEAPNYNCKANWVYGINISINEPLKHIGSNSIVYCIGHLLIRYFLEENQQIIYTSHRRNVTSFDVCSTFQLVASAEGSTLCELHLWNYHNLKTIGIIPIHHNCQLSLVRFSMNGGLIATVGERLNSPILIYSTLTLELVSDFYFKDTICDVVPFVTFLHEIEYDGQLQSMFICHSKTKLYVIESGYGGMNVEHLSQGDSDISCVSVVYGSNSNIYLKSFCQNKSCLYIITGHSNGSVRCVVYQPSNAGYQFQTSYDLLAIQDLSSIKQIKITQDSLLLSESSNITIYPLSILNQNANLDFCNEDVPLKNRRSTNSQLAFKNDANVVRKIELAKSSALKMLNPDILSIQLTSECIFVLSKAGDFFIIRDRELVFDCNHHAFLESQNIKRVNQIVHFGDRMQAICLAEKDKKAVILAVSENKRMYLISMKNHEMEKVEDLPKDEIINAIDTGTSEEGVIFIIYGCQSGKLIIRKNWEESSKVHDCQAPIYDLKISRDTSYLLVATNTSVLFFQINPNFSFPRKINFENQSPLSLNYLDNYKYATVSTSAKNVYLLEIPQLKHKNIFKESNNMIFISKMEVKYPSNQRVVNDQIGNISSEKGVIGGNMKYYLLALSTGEILFFENMKALEQQNYKILRLHDGDIVKNLVVTESQQYFFSLSEHSGMVVEWKTNEENKLQNNNKFERNNNKMLKCTITSKQAQSYEQMFYMIKHQSYSFFDHFDQKPSLTNFNFIQAKNNSIPQSHKSRLNNITYLFRGTTSDKLNKSLTKSIKVEQTSSNNSEKTALLKRHSNLILDLQSIYGLSSDKIQMVKYAPFTSSSQDSHIIYPSSKYLILQNLRTGSQQILQNCVGLGSKISYYDLSYHNDIIVGEGCQNAKIYINNLDNYLITTHSGGIIHFALWEDFILSYGICHEGYSINLHNYRTKQLLTEKVTNIKIMQFVMINSEEAVSIFELRYWQNMVSSDMLGIATSAMLLGNGEDVLLGGTNGELFILNCNGIFSMVKHAHQREITVMKLKNGMIGDRFGGGGDRFEVLTAGLDEQIKMWNHLFEEVLTIDLAMHSSSLFTFLKEGELLDCMFMRPALSLATSLDWVDDRILVGLNFGQVWQFHLTKTHPQNQNISSQKSLDSFQESEVGESQMIPSRNNKECYEVSKGIVLDAHCSHLLNAHDQYLVFDVHRQLPLIVTSANDSRLIFRNVSDDKVIGNFHCNNEIKQVRIKVVRFSPVGQMLVVGLQNGKVVTYLMKITASLQQANKTNQKVQAPTNQKAQGDINDQITIDNVSLEYFQTFHLTEDDYQMEIINISFSDDAKYFAVSYFLNRQKQKIKIGSQELRQGKSKIKVFEMKLEQNQEEDEAFYKLMVQIGLNDERNRNSNISMKYEVCSYQMSFVVEKNKYYLRIYEEYFDQNSIRVPFLKGRYLTYQLEDRIFINEEFSVDWSTADFSNSIQVKLQHLEQQNNLTFNQFNNQNGANHQDEDYSITAMRKTDKYLFYGSSTGHVHIVKVQSLDLSNTSAQPSKMSEMFMGRTYPCHTNPINEIKFSEDMKYMFVSAVMEECLVKFRVKEENLVTHLQYMEYPLQINDQKLHGEYPSREDFYHSINNLQPLREEITDILEDVEEQSHSTNQKEEDIQFEVCKVFGRRANDRRNNLAYFRNQIVYTLGPNLILQNISNSRHQEILPADPNPNSHQPQISTFHFNQTHLILATEEEKSRLFVWDISSLSCVQEMTVQCSLVYVIRLCGNGNAIFYGVNDHYKLVVQVINWQEKQVLGSMQFKHSGCWIIRDLAVLDGGNESGLTGDKSYFNNSWTRFVTCGHLHLSSWQIRGGMLVYHNFNTISDAKYMSVVSTGKYLVAGCEKGHLYLWSNQQFLYFFESAHQAVIRSLQFDYHNDILISGGKDGLVLFSKIENHQIICINRVELNEENQIRKKSPSVFSRESIESQKQSIKESKKQLSFVIGSSLNSLNKLFPTENQIQAICINPLSQNDNSQSLLVGTKTGDIYEIKYGADQNQVTKIQDNHDCQHIIGVAFSKYDKQNFFTLTNSGLVERWSLNFYKKLYVYDLQQIGKKIYACKEYLVICCRSEVVVFKIDLQMNCIVEMKDLCFSINKSDHHDKQSEITFFCLSNNQRDIALSMKPGANGTNTYAICIYQFGKKQPLFQLNNLKHEIDYLDFSMDQKYVLFKDKYQEIGMIHIGHDYKRINTIFVEMNIEWEQEGLRISPKAQKIYYSYNCENKITTICKLKDNQVIVGDEMGTVRIFQYPCGDDRLGELHLKCYTLHMNHVNCIRVHPDHTFVLTTALHDRSMILWRITSKPNKSIETK